MASATLTIRYYQCRTHGPFAMPGTHSYMFCPSCMIEHGAALDRGEDAWTPRNCKPLEPGDLYEAARLHFADLLNPHPSE